MINSGFFLGCPVEFEHICMVYPPKVKEVAVNKKFGIYMHLLTFSQEEIEDEYNRQNLDLSQLLTPFEYLLNNTYNSPQFKKLVEEAFYFFIHEPITFLFDKKQIVIGDIKELKKLNQLRLLTEKDYFNFQNYIRESCGHKMLDPPNPNENPRIKAMKAKARYRDQVKAQKNGGLNFVSTLSSICCMELGLNPLNIGELSYAAVPALIATYQNKEKYTLDIDSLLAGADAKKIKPKYWIQNLDI